MSLPNITIPLDLPIDIPVLLHPAVVHFVIAIPIVVLMLEIINLVLKKRALSVFSLFLLVVVMVAMVGAYFSGSVDGKEAFSLLSPEGQSELKEHKLIGTYLVYISAAMVLLKLLFMAFSKMVAKLFFVLILIGFIALTLIQGKDGGELVYKYGANNKAVAEVLSNKDDLQNDYDDLKEKNEESASAKAKEEPKEEPKVQEEKAPQTPAETTAEPKKEESATPEVKEEVAHEEAKPATEETSKTEEPKAQEHAVSLEIPAEAKPDTTHE
ncbi:MAG: hypothetical protein GXO60_09560 [Epsilonproteobacteria bacterium]|nr:hypothetical protein [Campylobacterota bacterium]